MTWVPAGGSRLRAMVFRMRAWGCRRAGESRAPESSLRQSDVRSRTDSHYLPSISIFLTENLVIDAPLRTAGHRKVTSPANVSPAGRPVSAFVLLGRGTGRIVSSAFSAAPGQRPPGRQRYGRRPAQRSPQAGPDRLARRLPGQRGQSRRRRPGPAGDRGPGRHRTSSPDSPTALSCSPVSAPRLNASLISATAQLYLNRRAPQSRRNFAACSGAGSSVTVQPLTILPAWGVYPVP